MWVIFAVLLGWLSGVRDAVKLHAAFIFLLTSERVRVRLFFIYNWLFRVLVFSSLSLLLHQAGLILNMGHGCVCVCVFG